MRFHKNQQTQSFSCGWLTILFFSLTLLPQPFLHGEESPSLDNIIAALEKQPEQVKSLYVELKYYSTINVEPKVLLSWPKYSNTLGLFNEENHFAYKGGKRYARRKQAAEFKLFRPMPEPKVDPKASPRDQEIQKQHVEDYQRGKREEEKWRRMGMDVVKEKKTETIHQTPDDARGDNGDVIWERRVDPSFGPPHVFISRRNPKRQWVQTPSYFGSIGWDCHEAENTQEERVVGGKRISIIDRLKNKDMTISKELVNLDGAQCVVLEDNFKLEGSTPARTISGKIKIWMDIEHGFAVRQRETHFDNGNFSRTVNSDLVEILPRVWFPKKSEVQNFAPSNAPKEFQGRPVLIWHSDLIKWIVNDVPDDLFDVNAKPGDAVFDSRLNPERGG